MNENILLTLPKEATVKSLN